MTDSPGNFVLTLPLATTPRDEAILRRRCGAACSAFNAMLGECLRRSRLMRESKAWRAAGKMPKGKEKSAAYRKLNEKYGFREYDLYGLIRTVRAGVKFHPGETSEQIAARIKGRVGYIGQHLDAHTVMAMAKRAFAAVQRAIFTGGKARFCRRGDFRSVQGINPQSAINWTGSTVTWCGLKIPAIINMADPVVAHGLQSRVKLTRIVRMAVKGRTRYFVQLTCEGGAYQKLKHKPGAGVVGLDIGPSTIAVVSDTQATIETFCDELQKRNAEIRRLQRQADRQVRANNPECFDERGRWRKGKRIAKRTRRMRRIRERAAELARREASHRKNLHGQLVHRVLAQGSDVRMEGQSGRKSYLSVGMNAYAGHLASAI